MADHPDPAAAAAATRAAVRDDRAAGTRSIEAITATVATTLSGMVDGVAEVRDALLAHDYLADDGLATAIFLALALQRPLLLEGEAGVGKTELAKVLAASLGAKLIRLQCYEGLDVNAAVYEWNYPRQMLEIRLLEARGEADHATAHDILSLIHI